MAERGLIIVESPTKIKTISKYLGGDYKLASTIGHFRQVAKGSVSWDDKHFSFQWELDKRKFQAIEKELKDVDHILIATDPDREGEAIGWHLATLLHDYKIPIKRIQFYEITKKAVNEAIKNPRDINKNLVEAYFTRIGLDYTIGFTLSPLLWKKMPLNNASAGRVQTPTLGFIVHREIERINFKPSYFYQINVSLKYTEPIDATVVGYKGQPITPKLEDKRLAEEITAHMPNSFKLTSINSKTVRLAPPTPFTTASLQQEASKLLGIKIQEVMKLSQGLYEGIDINGSPTALITYMRTDSMNMSKEATESIRKFLVTDHEPDIPDKPNIFQNKAKNIQEAHECIRPVNIDITPESIKEAISKGHYRLYQLIWARSIACQMKPGEREQSTYLFEAEDYQLKATNSIIKYKGYLHFYNNCTDKPSLPLNVNDVFEKLNHKLHTQETKPPGRYTESSILQKMEEEGIGRPSTYVSTISTLHKREFVHDSGKALIPTIKGFLVFLFMSNKFKKFIEPKFTSYIESILDDITKGEDYHLDIIDKLIKELQSTASQVEGHMFKVIGDQLIDIFHKTCEACGNKYELRYKYDFFLHCSNCNKNTPFYPPMEEVFDEHTKLVKFPHSKVNCIIHKDKKIYLPHTLEVNNKNYHLLLDLPKKLFEIEGEPVDAGVTKYGLYIKYKNKYQSINLEQLAQIKPTNFFEVFKR